MKIRPWMLAAAGLAAFAILVWYAGPLLSIGETAPLASARMRAALIALFVLQYLAQKAWSARHARKRNERVVDELAGRGASAESPEVAQLRKRFQSALATLRHTRFGERGGVWNSLSWKFGRQYLYQIPWYLIIGAPGTGKTTALLNSGLQFPLAGEFGRGAIKGIGGTRNCDWWFTDRAVLLDTAGRYTTHEADRVADRMAWEGFLRLLSRARPRRPLNGALVAVSVSDLLSFNAAQRAQHAVTLRARLDEIRAAIGMRIPVYLLVTKCDLLPGFLDSFLALDRSDRDQVWGSTFDIEASGEGRAGEEFAPAFDQLVAQLHEGLIERMQGERDPQRRARIYGFPRHFAALKSALDDLVRRVCRPDPAAGAENPPFLRGVYYTSGTQEGTPIDRALSALGRELGLEQQILPPNQSTGKSFFVACLLRDLVFAESEIAGRSPGLRRLRAMAVGTLLVGVQCAGAVAAGYWITSYSRATSEIEQISTDVASTRSAVEAADSRPGSDPRPLLPALDALRELAVSISRTGRAGDEAAPGFRDRQRGKLAAAARQAYERMLQEALLARVVQNVEDLMRGGADTNLQYEALKAYAMFHDPAHFDAAALKAFVTYAWDTSLDPPLRGEDRARALLHLDALLETGASGGAAPTNAVLIESVRARLAAQPLGERIATRVLEELGTRPYPDFAVAAAGAGAADLFAGRDGFSAPPSVAGRFTRDALRDGVLQVLPAVSRQLAAESGWVLAGAAQAGSAGDPEAATRVAAQALGRYLEDYVRAWEEFLGDLRLRRGPAAVDAARAAQSLGASDGPLAVVLRAAAVQTDFDSVHIEGSLGDAAAPLLARAAGHFSGLRQLAAAGADGRRPLDAALAELRSAPSARPEEVHAQARHYPDPVRAILLELAAAPAGARTVHDQAPLASLAPAGGKGLPQQVDALTAAACSQSVVGHFPFQRGSTREIAMSDFSRLFAPSGLFDGTFDRLLRPLVDTSTDPWIPTAAGVRAGVDSRTLARFRSAALIRDTFFSGRRPDAALKLTFRPHDMDETIDRFELDIDGQTVRYAHGPVIPSVVLWPGPASGARVEVTPASEGQEALQFDGPWAMFRLFDRVPVETLAPGRFRVIFNTGGRRASFDVEVEGSANPFRMPELERFDCPGSSANS